VSGPGYLTRPINYLGLCALSLSAGLFNGLPIGLQIVGKSFQKSMVLSLGQAFESSTNFHQHYPNLSLLGLD
jgi:aspartyl-tRNA(Asn)/glutamyl-tRNA(Gln) amidotransferase subunit A